MDPSRTLRFRSTTVVGAAAAIVVVVTGCGAGSQDENSAMNPTPTRATTADPVVVGEIGECFAVADTYLSVMLLPLDSGASSGVVGEGSRSESGLTLDQTADSLDEARRDLPQAVRGPFQDAAAQLRGYGDGLGPQELMEVRDTLEPVHDWLNERCSTVSVDQPQATETGP